MIDFSNKREARAREERLDPRRMAVAELMAWGWDAVDAMLAVGLLHEEDNKLDAQHAAVNLTADQNFDVLYKKRVKQLRNGAVLDEYQKLHPTPGSNYSNRGRPRKEPDPDNRKRWQGALEEPVSDREILAAMWSTITKLAPEDPKRVDLLDKYDKLKRRQGVDEDSATIHFYLPRPECDACPFRGNRIITEPTEVEGRLKRESGEDKEEFDPKRDDAANGRKRGRPPKKRDKPEEGKNT